jgi:DNA-binding CsgD family transcriptional regulator
VSRTRDRASVPSAPTDVRVLATTFQGHRALWIELPAAPSALPPSLTVAEREVVELLLAGRSNQEIADARGASYRTVANQLASIFRKVGVSSRVELVAKLSGE